MWTISSTIKNVNIKYVIGHGKKRISISTKQKNKTQKALQEQVYVFQGSY